MTMEQQPARHSNVSDRALTLSATETTETIYAKELDEAPEPKQQHDIAQTANSDPPVIDDVIEYKVDEKSTDMKVTIDDCSTSNIRECPAAQRIKELLTAMDTIGRAQKLQSVIMHDVMQKLSAFLVQKFDDEALSLYID